MKIDKLVLKNFRGYSDLTLELNGKSAVLIGENGAGKSSLLDAVAVGFSRFVYRLTSVSKRSFKETDIRNGRQAAEIELFTTHNGQKLSWGISRGRENGVKYFNSNALKSLVADLRGDNLFDKKEMATQMPLVVYYSVHRTTMGEENLSAEVQAFGQLSAYDGALTTGTDFANFLHWFHWRENLENEQKIVNRMFDLLDSALEAVRQAVYAFLPGFANLRVQRNPLQLLIDKGNETLQLNQLSDGEKCLLAMVADLARRLAIANPELMEPRTGHGVVCIDEIELHLHPGWQREVIPRLQEAFPNIQFLITTHSPQVLGEVKDMLIFKVIPGENGMEISPQPIVFGKDSNRILEDVLGGQIRNVEVKKQLSELFDAITDGDWEVVRKLQQALIAEVGHDEPELVKADLLIRRKRRLDR